MATRTAALTDLDRAISRFGHVLVEQEFRQGQHLKRGEAYKARFEVTHAPADAFAAIREFSLEQDIAPLNMRSAFEMAEVLEEMKPQGITLAQLCAAETSSTTSVHVGALCTRVANEGADHDSEAIRSLVRYCQEGQVHSEAYPLRFLVARKLLMDIGATAAQQAECTQAYEAPVCRRGE